MSITTEAMSVKDKLRKRLATSTAISGKIQGLQETAFAALENQELPTTRDEYWKYTRITPFLKKDFIPGQPETTVDPISYQIEGLDCYSLVFVNGVYSEKLSDLPSGDTLQLRPFSEMTVAEIAAQKNHLGQLAEFETQIFTALNTAYATDGSFVSLKAGTVLEKPLHLVYVQIGNQTGIQTRNLLVFETNSQATIIESHQSLGGVEALTNTVSEIVVAANANIDHYLLQYIGDNSAYVGSTNVIQENDSQYSLTTLTLRGRMVRNNTNVQVNGTGCFTQLNGIYLTKGKQHVDNHTLVDHLQQHCNSSELYKGIMDEQSTGVFNGKVFVRQAAQKTNAFQSNQNILLSDDATVNSKPELEIYADDVKCSHGSTTGQLDEEAIYYLRTRGIGEAAARRLMVQAFVSDVVNQIKVEPLRQKIEQHIAHRYEGLS